MKYLLLRSLREIRSTKAQFISIILIIAIGSAIFSGLFSTVTLIETWLKDYYATYDFADGWVYVKAIDSNQIITLQDDHSALTIEGRYSYQLDSVLKGESVTYRFYTPTTINGLMLIQGSLNISDNEILIDDSFAEKNNLKLNDPISITVDDHAFTYLIKGTFQSPEFAYKSKDFSDSMSNKKGFGIIYATPDVLIELNHHSKIYLDALSEATTKLNTAQADLDSAHQKLLDQQKLLDLQKAQIIKAYSANPVLMQQVLDTLTPHQDQLNKALKEYKKAVVTFNNEKIDALAQVEKLTSAYFELLTKGTATNIEAFVIDLESQDLYQNHRLQADHPAFTMLDNVLAPIKVMTSIFPILFFLVASIVILISMSKTIENERTQIAVFKALGMSKSTIRMSYLLYGWWAALAGSVVFALFGNYFIPRVLMGIFVTRFSLPPPPYAFYPIFTFAAIGLAVFFASAAILLAMKSILNEIPAQGMRPKPPKSAQRSTLERWPWFWTRLSYTQKLITRNILMGKFKILLSSIGIIGSIALLITGLSLRNSATAMISGSINSYQFQYAIKTAESVDLKSFVLPIKTETIEKSKVIPAEINDINVNIQILQAHQTLLSIKNHSGSLIDLEKNSVVITKSMAIIFHYAIGDRIDFIADDITYSVIVTNISNQYLNKSITLSFEQAESLGLDIATDKIYVSNPNHTIDQTEIDTLMKDNQILAVDTKIKYQTTANEMLRMLNSLIMVIVFSALLLSITVIYNLASINIFERQRELATLRVLGYTVREVENLVYTENYLLTFLGVAGGLPAGIFLYQTIAHLVSSSEFIMNAEINISIILLSVIAGFFFTFMTNRILHRKIVKIKLVESLKAVE